MTGRPRWCETKNDINQYREMCRCWPDQTADALLSSTTFRIWQSTRFQLLNRSDHWLFSSPEPKAHRWAYRIPMVRRPSASVRPSSTISNIFFSKTTRPIKAKFNVEPPWEGGRKVCSRHLGHMTNMAATPIYGKNPSKIFFSRTGGPISTKLGM